MAHAKRPRRPISIAGPLLAAAGIAALVAIHAPPAAAAVLATVAAGWTALAWYGAEAAARARVARDMEAELAEIGDEFHTLLGEVAGRCQEQFARGREELAQLRGLLADACERLLRDVETLRAQAETQQALLEVVAPRAALAGAAVAPEAAGAELPPGAAGELWQVRAAVDATLNEATTALQFEDLASQLLAHVDDRFHYLQTLLDGLTAIDGRLASEAAAATLYQARLERMKRALEEAAALVERTEHKAVAQERLTAGEIELF